MIMETTVNTDLVIFDLDGTLLDTIGDLAVACNAVLALRGLPQHSYEEYCHFVGNGIMRLVERALPEELRTPYRSGCSTSAIRAWTCRPPRLRAYARWASRGDFGIGKSLSNPEPLISSINLRKSSICCNRAVRFEKATTGP